MPETLEQMIARLKREGKSAMEVQQILRDQGNIIPWIEVRRIYMET